jgi:hypothetical protein
VRENGAQCTSGDLARDIGERIHGSGGALGLIRSGGRVSYAARCNRSYAAGLIRPAEECRRRWL